jgi:G8 domain/Right handed beta helix region
MRKADQRLCKAIPWRAIGVTAISALVAAMAGAAPTAAPVQRWSNPDTWGGSKPGPGANVLIPRGKRVLLDEDTAALAGLTIEGELAFEPDGRIELQADYVMIHAGGALRAGSASRPVTGSATITLRGANVDQDIDGMGTRGILLMNGTLDLHGTPPRVPWTRLAAHAAAGSKRLTLDRAVDWKAGDHIVVAPTEWYPNPNAPQDEQDAWALTERLKLSSVNAAELTTTRALGGFHWGRMQYATDKGMSLTPGRFTKPHPDAADQLDERAEVGNLSRNIVIQGIDDALWRNSGFGAHVMVMDRASAVQIDGVEFRRVGQAGRIGRYPMHWHLLSYDAAGNELGDAAGHEIRNSTIWDSRQRCIVIHGTNGVQVRHNICYDIKGHAIFLEDAVERRNIITGNLVLKVRSPSDTLALAQHERRDNGCGASAGYWLTNPDNTVRGNAVADAQGNGFWLSYPRRPVKQNINVPIRPNNLAHGAFENNVSRANGNAGLMLECAMIDDAGNLELLAYAPTTNGSEYDYTNGLRFTLKGITTAKNRGGYVNRTITPDYLQWAAADNIGRAFTGSVQISSTLKQSLIVGRSLNNRQPYPADVDPQLGVASYHSQMDIAKNTFIGFDNRGYVLPSNGWDRSSGAFGTDDYYVRAVEKGLWRNPGNRLVEADPGYRALPPHLQPGYTAASNNNWTLAGAIWDPQGYWGAAGRYSVLDVPFLAGARCVPLKSTVPAGIANGLSCPGPYYGVGEFELNRGLPGATQRYLFMETIEATRLDAADQEIGRWRVEQGYTSTFLGNMRHFAAVKGGSYVLRFPSFPDAGSTKEAPRWVSMTIDNLLGKTDSMMLAVHYSGAVTPSRVVVSTNPDYAVLGVDTRALSPAASRAEVAAGAGDRYWRDVAADLLWVKLTRLGLDAPWIGVEPGSDADLYRAYQLRIEP